MKLPTFVFQDQAWIEYPGPNREQQASTPHQPNLPEPAVRNKREHLQPRGGGEAVSFSEFRKK